ncbi:MAG: membrane protein insertase YidC [Gemmatimonadota bacterium]
MERRTVWAIILMMLIAIAPAFFAKRNARPAGSAGAASAPALSDTSRAIAPLPTPALDSTGRSLPPVAAGADSTTAAAAAARVDTVIVTSNLYRYVVSARGARLVGARLTGYKSLAIGEQGQPLELLRDSSDMLGLALVAGGDTIPIRDWIFTPSATALTVDGPTPLVLTATNGGLAIELTYTFTPDYRIGVTGRVTGLGPNGGLVLVDLGDGLRNAEADSVGNARAFAFVVKDDEARRHDFSGLKAGIPTVVSGPFEWAALKSKYFVTALFAFDSTTTTGRISGVTAVAPVNSPKRPITARVRASMPVTSAGILSYSAYAGPMEHPRLAAIGHEFDDVNPYGYPGFRTVIRFFSVPVRWLLVAMHERLHLAYGAALILFGILVRLLLWPLNQKAMRANMRMQAVQPLVKSAQERHKDDPQAAQQEMFRLYKEHGVNPMGGCWPMLLPMPILLALFFVFQYSIELRGASFLWLPDLASKDPYYILPLLMGLSMLVLSKVGQKGMEPNPQMQMTTYLMPAIMTVFFINFASGLNLYYAVSNIASIPQQWMLAQERIRRMPPPPKKPVPKAARPA